MPAEPPSSIGAPPEDVPAVDPAGEPWPAGFARSRRDREALAVLLGLAGVTPRRLLQHAHEHPRAAACLAAVAEGRLGGPADRRRAGATSGRDLLERAARAGARFITVEEDGYPRALSDLADPPAGLFAVGRPLPSDGPVVAVVGARRCSVNGGDVARRLARDLGRAGVVVVSGGARGIDGAAHEGALAGGAPTIAVLGSGIDVAYPPAHRSLLSRIASAGTLISEYPPGVPAERFRFPARNRIIAGLARAVVVVEGARGSGSMITAEHALDLGREVFAVPGPVTSELSFAPHELIREGAVLIRSAGDVLAELGLAATAEGETPGDGLPPGLTEEERSVVAALHGATELGHVASGAGVTASRVLSVLVGLELRGVVRQTGGRWQRRVAP